jgi:hypothetical protein
MAWAMGRGPRRGDNARSQPGLEASMDDNIRYIGDDPAPQRCAHKGLPINKASVAGFGLLEWFATRYPVGFKLTVFSWLLTLGALGGCATMSIDGADRAQLADVATTGVGVSSGLVEANPIMAPLTGGPVGLGAMAGIKLGFNRMGRHQDPATCRHWLCLSTAAGWGAAYSNLVMLVAPPLFLAAVPVAIESYYSAWKGTALETCYAGQISDAILRVPENTRINQMPAEQRRELMQIAGWWPEPYMMPGTRPVDGYILVHLLLIDKASGLQQLIVRYDLDWTVVGVQDREGNNIMALDLATLAPYMLPQTKGEPATQSGKALVSAADIAEGLVTIPKYRGRVWRVAGTDFPGSKPLSDETQQVLAGRP